MEFKPARIGNFCFVRQTRESLDKCIHVVKLDKNFKMYNRRQKLNEEPICDNYVKGFRCVPLEWADILRNDWVGLPGYKICPECLDDQNFKKSKLYNTYMYQKL